jgi:hypothetical protein
MPDFKDPFIRWCTGIVVVLFVLLAFLSEESFRWRPFLVKVVEEFIIALILAVVVDTAVKKRLAKEITQDVWPYASAQGLPEGVKDHSTKLLRMPFIREDLRLHVRLDRIPETPDFLRATLTATFFVRNLSEEAHVHTFRSKIEKSDHPEKGESRIEYIFVKDQPGFPIEGAELTRQMKERPSFFEFEYEVRIPPASRGPVQIRTQRSRIYRQIDMHMLDLLETTIGVTVVAEGPDDLTWDAQFGGSAKPDNASRGNVQEWYHPGLHFPGHVIIVRWQPKMAATAA